MGNEVKAEEKIWTRSFTILTFCNFVVSMTMWLLSVEMVQYAHVEFGASESLAGATMTCFVIAAALARILLGAKTDEWGAKKTLLLLCAINIICPFAYLLCGDIWSLLAVRSVHGVAFGLGTATASAAVLVLPASRRGEGIGYFTLSQAVATAIGPFLAINAVTALGSFDAVFIALGILCIFTFCTLFALQLPPAACGRAARIAAGIEDPDASKGSAKLSLNSFVEVSLIPLVSVVCLAYVGYSGLSAFMTLYASELGLAPYASLFFVAYAVAMIITRPRVGKYVDGHGPKLMIRLSMSILVVGFLLMASDALVTSLFGSVAGGLVLLFAAAMTGFGIGNTQSVVQTIVAMSATPDNLGKANSTFFLSMDFGSGVGPVAIGLVIPFIGYPATYLMLAFVAVIGLLIYRSVERKGRGHIKAGAA